MIACSLKIFTILPDAVIQSASSPCRRKVSLKLTADPHFLINLPMPFSTPVTHCGAVAPCRARGSGRGSCRGHRRGGRLDGPVPFICTRRGHRSLSSPCAVLDPRDSLRRCRSLQGSRLWPRILSWPPARRPARRSRPLHLHPPWSQVTLLSLCRSRPP